MPDTFCILPWIHLFITPGGLVRLCCQAADHIALDQSPMSLYTNTVDDIWNSNYMCSARQKMLEGQRVNACQECYAAEEQLSESYRIFSNNAWTGLLGSFETLIEASKRSHYRVLKPPISFQLIPGPKCNLKCRICTTIYSSQIQRDPIHSQWCYPKRFLEPEVINWQQGNLTVGPEPIAGVKTSGFYDTEVHDNRILRWTRGDALLSFDVPRNLALKYLKIKVWEHHAPKGHNLAIFVNDRRYFNAEMQTGPLEKNFDLSEELVNGPVTVRLKSDTFRVSGDHRRLGIALENVEVTCVETSRPQQTHLASGSTKSYPDRPWFDHTEWIIKELFTKPETLKELYFTGGEPMIQEQVADIIDFCIEQQITDQVSLKFNTNCTVLPNKTLTKLRNFPKLFVALSIDGYGSYWEYIRYPGKWDQVTKNISKYVNLENAHVFMVPVLQMYNALNIVELLMYSDQMGLDCSINPLTTPWFLSVSILPFKAKAIAARRLRRYAQNDCRPKNSRMATKIADFVESVKDNCTNDALKTFMHFTNDLDATRNQSFQKIHAELLSLIEETGFRWTDQRRFTSSDNSKVIKQRPSAIQVISSMIQHITGK